MKYELKKLNSTLALISSLSRVIKATCTIHMAMPGVIWRNTSKIMVKPKKKRQGVLNAQFENSIVINGLIYISSNDF